MVKSQGDEQTCGSPALFRQATSLGSSLELSLQVPCAPTFYYGLEAGDEI
jgi:hypothetical protein